MKEDTPRTETDKRITALLERRKKFRKKRKRVPLDGASVLSAPAREGYFRRIVNDVGDRIARFMDAGYEPVVGDDVSLAEDERVEWYNDGSSFASRSVGGGVTGVLMEIPETLHREDQKRKQEKIDQLEESMKSKKSEGQYGDITVEHNYD